MNEVMSRDGGLGELAERINAEHAQVEAALRTGLQHARTAGELLLEAKGKCRHGQWLPWLEANVRFTVRTAQTYMRIAREWPRLQAKCETVSHLGYREAIALLNGPAEGDPLTAEQAAEDFQEHVHMAVAAAYEEIDEKLAWCRTILAKPDASFEEVLKVRNVAFACQQGAAELKIRTEMVLGALLTHSQEAPAPQAQMTEEEFDARVKAIREERGAIDRQIDADEKQQLLNLLLAAGRTPAEAEAEAEDAVAQARAEREVEKHRAEIRDLKEAMAENRKAKKRKAKAPPAN